MFGGTRSIGRSKTALVLAVVLFLGALLILLAACKSLTPGSPGSTAAGATTTTIGRAPDFYLDQNDFGSELQMRVGDRVRVDLTDHATDKVTSVEWRYEPVVVHQVDVGATEVSGFITGCWVELEAVSVGRVTVRTIYARSDGSTRVPWWSIWK